MKCALNSCNVSKALASKMLALHALISIEYNYGDCINVTYSTY